MKKKSWKQWVGEFFHFTRSERIAITVLLAGLLLIKIAPYYWPVREPAHVQIPDSLLQKLIAADRLDTVRNTASWTRTPIAQKFDRSFNTEKKNRPEGWTSPNSDHVELFAFDPNRATEMELERLGLTPSMVRTLIRFREKGGRFRSPGDIRKVYGIPPSLADRLEPFVQIHSDRSAPSKQVGEVKNLTRPGSLVPEDPRPRSAAIIDINKADSLDWLALPGIGPKLSSRILQYRNRLGGFYSIEQVAEVFGLSDTVYQRIRGYLRIESGQPRQVNINEARLEELAAHPYIRWKLADAIVQYRTTHGSFRDSRELAKLHMVNDELLNKLIYYCKIE